MNRRQFSARLGALLATPALPSGALAQVSKTPVPLHQFQHPYSWAAFIARVHNKATPNMLKRHLSLDDDMAQKVYKTLVRENVITAPNAAGISHAVTPFARNGITASAINPKTSFQKKVKLIDQDHSKVRVSENADLDADEINPIDSDDVNQDTPQLPDATDSSEDSPIQAPQIDPRTD